MPASSTQTQSRWSTPKPKGRQTIDLYPKQDDFVWDEHTFAAFVAGIGSGKTQGGAYKAMLTKLDKPTLGLVVGPNYRVLRDTTWRTCKEIWAPLIRKIYQQEKIIALHSGAEVLFRSAHDPENLRGPNVSWAWIDEAALCRPETWGIVIGRLRQGGSLGQCWVTTTPKGKNWVWKVFAAPTRSPRQVAQTYTVKASTRENLFVDEDFEATMRDQYTIRYAQQELDAEWLEDVQGALWQSSQFEPKAWTVPDLVKIVVAIDPAVTHGENSDMTGIVAAGIGVDGLLYVLEDRTCRESPEGWARAALDLFVELQADALVAEVNNGGDMVESVLRTAWATGCLEGRYAGGMPYEPVHAARGKRTRAEPVAVLYSHHRVRHAPGLSQLEDQMVSWVPGEGDSPDRVDALVWAATALGVDVEVRSNHEADDDEYLDELLGASISPV